MHEFEGCKLTAYLCPANIWTIGWGNTKIPGKPVTKGMTCTREEADEEFLIDTQDSQKAVNRLVKVALTQGQFNALVDFVFNLGAGRLKVSTLRKKINAGVWDEIPGELNKWVYGGGRKLKGLVLRRQAESAYFS